MKRLINIEVVFLYIVISIIFSISVYQLLTAPLINRFEIEKVYFMELEYALSGEFDSLDNINSDIIFRQYKQYLNQAVLTSSVFYSIQKNSVVHSQSSKLNKIVERLDESNLELRKKREILDFTLSQIIKHNKNFYIENSLRDISNTITIMIEDIHYLYNEMELEVLRITGKSKTISIILLVIILLIGGILLYYLHTDPAR